MPISVKIILLSPMFFITLTHACAPVNEKNYYISMAFLAENYKCMPNNILTGYCSWCVRNFPVFVIARSLRRGNLDRNMTIDAKRLDCFAAARKDGVPVNGNLDRLIQKITRNRQPTPDCRQLTIDHAGRQSATVNFGEKFVRFIRT